MSEGRTASTPASALRENPGVRSALFVIWMLGLVFFGVWLLTKLWQYV